VAASNIAMIRVKAILMPHLIADRSVFTGNWVAVISISGTIVPRAVRLHKHHCAGKTTEHHEPETRVK
jgi:hypothetical protein